MPFDKLFTSVQTRAIRTGNLALDAAKLSWLPVERDWRLNERHYGALTGLDKAETAAKHGEEQVKVWRRSYDTPPPPLEAGGEFDLSKDRRYAGVEGAGDGVAEAHAGARAAVLERGDRARARRRGKNLIIAAHGNSLRAIVKHLFRVPDGEIVGVEIPTGNPLLIELDASAEAEDRALSGRCARREAAGDTCVNDEDPHAPGAGDRRAGRGADR